MRSLRTLGHVIRADFLERVRRHGFLITLGATLWFAYVFLPPNGAKYVTLAALLGLGGLGMQLLRAEDTRIDVVALFLPLLVVTLPALLVVSGVAVLFESVRWLRGGLGNVIYFFVWGFMVAATRPMQPEVFSGIGDFLGASVLLPSIMHSAATAFPGMDIQTAPLNIGFNFSSDIRDQPLQAFAWAGSQWTAGMLASRLLWAALGPALAFAASIPFDRFDTGVAPARARKSRGQALPTARAEERLAIAAQHFVEHLPAAKRASSLLLLLRGELSLLLAGSPWAWRFLALGLASACWVSPLRIAREILLPIAWIWPMLAWSTMGAREQLHNTQALMFSSPRPLARQLTACWAAGAMLSVAIGLGVGVRLLASGDAAAAAAWLIGALFIPTLALACGVWTGNGKLFEITFLMLWYVGPMNHLAPLDFAATRADTLAAEAPLKFAIATLALAGAAVAGRWRTLRT